MRTLKLPRRFFVDHSERDLPTPEIVGSHKAYFVVAADDPALEDLLSDAEYYADKFGPDCDIGLKSSARATVRKIAKAMAKA